MASSLSLEKLSLLVPIFPMAVGLAQGFLWRDEILDLLLLSSSLCQLVVKALPAGIDVSTPFPRVTMNPRCSHVQSCGTNNLFISMVWGQATKLHELHCEPGWGVYPMYIQFTQLFNPKLTAELTAPLDSHRVASDLAR